LVNRRRENGHNLARCNSTLFTGEGGATLELCQETSASFGVLGRRTCAHCSALLFDAESVAIPGRCEEVRGRSCCSNGDVVLLPVRELPVLRDMWRGECGDGTRLLALRLSSNGRLLEAKIISGTHRGRIVLLPRIDLTPEEGAFPFKWKRRQFPVRAAFVMTVNKSQGQSLRCVGIYLAQPCFSHGQLYVACSRVGHPKHLWFALLPDEATGEFHTRNVVFKEALTC
jgi:hypothetical protein